MSNSNIDEGKGTGGRGPAGSNKHDTFTRTPPSPRKSWIKIGVIARARSVENMQPVRHCNPSPRPKSPPLTLASGSPGVASNKIPTSPFETPPKKMWESGFKSFLSRRSQHAAETANLPEVPLMAPMNIKNQSLVSQKHNPSQQSSLTSTNKCGTTEKGDAKGSDQSVRGGKIFQSIFGGTRSFHRKDRRKAKSMNELDAPMRNGKEKNYSPEYAERRRVQSQADIMTGASSATTQGDLNQSLRRASYAGTSSRAIVPSPIHHQQHHYISGLIHPHQQPQSHPTQQHDELSPLPPAGYHIGQSDIDMCSQQLELPFSSQAQHPQSQHPAGLPIPAPAPNPFQSPATSGASSHSMSPSSATTEIKKAFTEFHNSSRYARDSTSAYLGDEPSTRRGDAHASMLNAELVAQKTFSSAAYARNYSHGNMESSSGHRCLSSSLPTVDENVSIHKSLRMLRPFQMVDSWQAGRRYLIGPAALSSCPLLAGLSSVSLSESNRSRNTGDTKETSNDGQARIEIDGKGMVRPPARLPPLFGCIVLGRALLSYVIQEPTSHYQQRWWSSCILILRQNYLLEYDQQTSDVVQGMPRGYAHMQYSKSYAHPDFVDALELEFYVSPCAKADKRVLTIRLQEDREKRDNWIACLNRAAQIGIRDLYDYDESAEIGRGRYAKVIPARRRVDQTQAEERSDNSLSVLAAIPDKETACALKIFDKKEFWRRVVKGRERAGTLVRETSIQATMTTKCSKIPAFVRLRGFFETSDTVVLELELLEGMDLFQYVSSKGVLCEKEAACILRDILTVLDGLKRMGVAHRDIKPANCLMCKGSDDISLKQAPFVKVADFGMATFVGVDGLVRGRCGTPGYVAPEIFSAGLHGGYGNKVDVFSAGVVLYVMLAGYEPFYGESDDELIAANKEAKLDFPTSDWTHVSLDAKQLVRSMMEPAPRQRLSAQEALRHPWIVQHAGSTECVEVFGHSGVDALGHAKHKGGEACTIS